MYFIKNHFKILFFLILVGPGFTLPTDDKMTLLMKVNKIRASGCYCGRKWMPPANALKWSETLEQSAISHGKDMYENNFFAHFSSKGEDIGQRLDLFGYKWQYVGENLGEGQSNFDEVLKDWLQSKSHCRMLMNDNMREMAVIQYKQYWVQHFATQMPH
jgi:uncharacterized protein YkwD